ncbi:hypothetical protein B296_00013702 [Ensete ventricosum]|uniref:Uncharacterized protein n=1 Tax=Ensete ventricosum TaxID=4639 RepID=A0A427B3Z4_ENSVE|nr:hypothetical protein B296_00013702 [Ensete ventricosum]
MHCAYRSVLVPYRYRDNLGTPVQIATIFYSAFYENMVKVAKCVTFNKAVPSFPSSFPHLFSGKDNLRCLIPCAIDQVLFVVSVSPKIDRPRPIEGEIHRQRSIEEVKGKKKKRKRRKKKKRRIRYFSCAVLACAPLPPSLAGHPRAIAAWALFLPCEEMEPSPSMYKAAQDLETIREMKHLILDKASQVNRYAFSGGQDSIENHRKYGANLEVILLKCWFAKKLVVFGFLLSE